MTVPSTQHIILGIRHHGPGSARSVMEQLRSLQPDAIALEWPDGSQDTIQHISHEEVVPPIAQIQYLKANPKQISLLPLASFSPEWQVIQFAHKNNIPLYPIDLPYSQQVQINEKPTNGEESHAWSLILEKTGFERIESFWDHYFERDTRSLDDFQRLTELMAEIRSDRPPSKLNAVREAYMRMQLRNHLKTHKNLVTVVGAYHSPALSSLEDISATDDKKKLKGLRKKTTTTALIPFSYARLASASGYAAGVDAPLLYDIQFQFEKHAGQHWMAKTARLLRQEGFHVSPSEAQAAVEMSQKLADLRQMNFPGQNELLQSAQATLCHGKEAPFQRIQQQALIGNKSGSVPDHLISSPLIKEFMQSLRSLRLSKYWAPKTAPKKTPSKELDLRKPLHQKCSAFLHTLHLMHMQWAQKGGDSERNRGSFREQWFFDWDIDHEIQLFQWGTQSRQLESLARELLRERWKSEYTLKKLIEDLENVLLAELPGITPELIRQMDKQSATTDDLLDIVPATSSLFSIAMYGNVRDLDKRTVGQLAEQLHEKICTLLPYQCSQLDDDFSRDLFTDLDRYSSFIRSIHREKIQQPWLDALHAMILSSSTDHRLSAWALRQLLDAEQISPQDFKTQFHRHLSTPHEPEKTAAWLEGLLTGSATLLLYHDPLFSAVELWVQDIPDDIFQEVLPILNRTFSDYSLHDRKSLWQRILRPENQKTTSFADHFRSFALKELLGQS